MAHTCIVKFTHQVTPDVHIGMISSCERLILIHIPVLFDTDGYLNLVHIFSNHISVTNCHISEKNAITMNYVSFSKKIISNANDRKI